LDAKVHDSKWTSVSEAKTTALGAQLPVEHSGRVILCELARYTGCEAGRVRIPEKLESTKETLPPVTPNTVPRQLLSMKIEFLTVTCAARNKYPRPSRSRQIFAVPMHLRIPLYCQGREAQCYPSLPLLLRRIRFLCQNPTAAQLIWLFLVRVSWVYRSDGKPQVRLQRADSKDNHSTF
jgi:hypothetical protein